jgi:hypothetical protein
VKLKIAHYIKANYLLKSIVLIFSIFLLINVSKAQTTIQMKFSPMSLHPFDNNNKHLFHNTIDANGIFSVEPMFILPIETYISGDILSWRIAPGFLSDAVGFPAMFIHLGLKRRLIQMWRNSISLAIGGNLYGREIWSRIPGYLEDNAWAQNGKWEYKLGIMAELEYSFFINDKNDITFSAMYGHQPESFAVSVGYRYWFSNVIKNPPNCGSCPFQKTQKGWRP